MIGEHTDRVYTNTPPEHIITNVVSGRKMRVQKYNFPDTVIWNPWVDKAKEIPDFGNYSYMDHLYITSAKRWVVGVRKMTIFADLQYYLC